MTWASFLDWITNNKIGDLAGIVGLAITIVGFIATLYNVSKSKKAATAAKEAAESTRDSFKRFETVVDFSSAISRLEEIKRLHREGAWGVLPDRYAELRKILIVARTMAVGLSENQKTIMQTAIQNLTGMEQRVERSLKAGTIGNLVPDKFNSLLSRDTDGLIRLLAEIKIEQAGGVK